ncbi:MAG: hypothetical protein F6J90_32250 [Moorea sp. SIOASIH]|nr:hypothetical protein [Moorena bouillonii]NEO40756.1 hypothetical protein [Moorena sp. SIOASIH]
MKTSLDIAPEPEPMGNFFRLSLSIVSQTMEREFFLTISLAFSQQGLPTD